MLLGLVVLVPKSAYARLAWPTHPSRTNKKVVSRETYGHNQSNPSISKSNRLQLDIFWFPLLTWYAYIDSSKTISDSLECLELQPIFSQNLIGSYMIGNWFSLIIARNPVFNRPTPPIVYVNISITKTWVTLWRFSSTRGLGPNPWFPSGFLF
jgi:hypothetical protein